MARDDEDKDEGEIEERPERKPAKGTEKADDKAAKGQEDADDEIEVVEDEADPKDKGDGERREARDPKTERNREASRRRKENRRQGKERDRRELAELRASNAELRKQVDGIAGRQTEAEKARVADTLEGTRAAIEDIQRRRLQAFKDDNGELANQLDTHLYKLRRQEENLEEMAKTGAGKLKPNGNGTERTGEGGGNGAGPKFTRDDQDAIVAFLDDHDWIDPRGQDADSRKALAIDRKMLDEGFKPSDEDWAEELESRLKKALPHRFEDDDEPDDRRSQARRSPPTGGRGREGGKGGPRTFRLTSAHKDALAQANIEKGTPAYNKLIRQWADEADGR